MRRDIKKAIAEGEALVEKNERLGLNVAEISQIREQAQAGSEADTIYNLIVDAFHAGLAIGYRNRGK